jgi:hypothetical protein
MSDNATLLQPEDKGPFVWLSSRWNSFWFAPSDGTNLAICRILFFLGLAIVYPTYVLSTWDMIYYPQWGDVPAYFNRGLPGIFSWLGLQQGNYETLTLLNRIFYFALICCGIGLFTRTSTWLVLLLGFYLWGLPQCFGKIYHTTSVPVFMFAIFAVSRCGDRLSIDALIRKKLGWATLEHLKAEGTYTWPVRLAWATFALCFFAAGISKVTLGGWEWLVSDQMKWNCISHHYNEYHVAKWTLPVVCIPGFSPVASAATIVFELAGILILFNSKVRAFVVGNLVFMQFGIWLLMGVPFTLWLVSYVFFVPWDKLIRTKSRQN